jgi:hypothetical protein
MPMIGGIAAQVGALLLGATGRAQQNVGLALIPGTLLAVPPTARC